MFCRTRQDEGAQRSPGSGTGLPMDARVLWVNQIAADPGFSCFAEKTKL